MEIIELTNILGYILLGLGWVFLIISLIDSDEAFKKLSMVSFSCALIVFVTGLIFNLTV